ncbi:MAG: hypothetical protein H0X36_02460 [Sphingomonadaceae bacterium]|nr:hypothetical protein [Sphingomonadaceae bacterium]
MAQALIRKLNENTLAAYRASAEAKGRSLEAELREVLERNQPMRPKDPDYLEALSKRLRATTLDGPGGTDSTPHIRWARDTNHGKLGGAGKPTG